MSRPRPGYYSKVIRHTSCCRAIILCMIESQSNLIKRFIAIEMHPAVYACLVSVNICIWLAYHCVSLSASPAFTETPSARAASTTAETRREPEKAIAKEPSRTFSAMSLPRMARADESPVLLSAGSAAAASADSLPAPEAAPVYRPKSKLPTPATRKNSARKSSTHKAPVIGKNYLVPPPPPMAIFDHGYQIDQTPVYSSHRQASHQSHYQPRRSRDKAQFVTVDRYNRVVVSR
ncbi:MAG: hypothetical protein IPM23_11125 [Candidatus Melainabacteria bacterium]|nr:hypothetical protein [Candidatus Melainabacteria bacterium]